MTVEEEEDDENQEFQQVYSIVKQNDGKVGKAKDCNFYRWYDTFAKKNKCRQEYGAKCLNCGDDNHFVRSCDRGT